MADIVGILTYFGITASQVTPLVIVGGIVMFFVHKHTGPIRSSIANVSEKLTDVKDRFLIVESRVSDLWKDKVAPSSSPRQLNEIGKSILESSKIDSILAPYTGELLEAVRKKNPSTAYDAERCITEIVLRMPVTHPALLDKLKDGAFKAGVTVDGILFVGSIKMRDMLFPSLGFALSDLP